MAGIDDITETPLMVEGSDPLAKAIGLMKQNDASGVIVTNNGKLAGVIDDGVLLRFEGDAQKAKCSTLAKKAPVLDADSSPEDVVADFLNSEAALLPVVKREKVAGAVTRNGALKLLVGLKSIDNRKVSELMSSPAATVSEDATLAQAVTLMRGRKIYRVVAVDSKGKIAGMFSSYDLATRVTSNPRAAFAEKSFSPSQGGDLMDAPLSQMMVTDVATIGGDASLKEAVKQMVAGDLRALVVERSGKPIGVLSPKNVFEACLVAKPLNVFVHGLAPEEKMLKESIVDEAAAFLERIGKFARLAPDDSLELHVKSNREGFKRRFEIQSRATVGGRMFASRQPPNIDEHRNNWDAHLAVRESLDELEKLVRKDSAKARTVKRDARGLARENRGRE